MVEYGVDRRCAPKPDFDGPYFPVHQGKSFFVTGATGGVGSRLAEMLLIEGARVVLADLDHEKVRALVDRLGGNDAGVHGVTLDLLDWDSLRVSVATAVDLVGRIDGLANVAGICMVGPALEHTREYWDIQFGINLFGPFELSRLIAKHMVDAGHPGAIVSISSDAGKVGHPDSIAYDASKAGIINMTRVLAKELAPHDINVNCVVPTGIDTPMLQKVAVDYGALAGDDPDFVYKFMENEQLGRHVTTTEVASTVSFLLSNRVLAIRGTSINVDGGDLPY